MGKHKHVDTNQHAAKKPHGSMNGRRNQTISQDKLIIKTAFQHLYEAAKAVLRGKFIAIQTYPKKQENSQT